MRLRWGRKMSTIPYFLRNPNLDDQAQQPMTMAPAAAPQGMATPVVQHPMHAMIAPIVGAPLRMSTLRPAENPGQEPAAMNQGDISGVGGDQMSAPVQATPSAIEPKQPTVRTMSPIERREDQLQQGMAQKPEGFWGNLKHYAGIAGRVAGDIVAPAETELVVRGLGKEGIGPRANEFRNQEMRGLEKERSEQALQGAQTGNQQAETNLHNTQEKAAQLVEISPEEAQSMGNPALAGQQVTQAVRQHLLTTANTVQGRSDVAEQNNDTKLQIAEEANQIRKELAEGKGPHLQHVAGTLNGKEVFANYNPSLGQFTDQNGETLADFHPTSRAMQGVLGQYAPMRLAGQLLNTAYNVNPALLPSLGPIIAHMLGGMPGAGPGLQEALSSAPTGQPQNSQGAPIGLHMPEAPTGATKSRGQFAESILPSITDAQTQIKSLASDLGPMAGRYNELATSKIGAYGPQFSGLQTTLHNVATAWMRLHANSDAARQDFVNQLKAAQSPDNLIAVLDSINKQAKDYVQQGKGRGGQGPASSGGNPGVPKGATHTVPGSDGKMHYTDGKNDLGVVK